MVDPFEKNDKYLKTKTKIPKLDFKVKFKNLCWAKTLPGALRSYILSFMVLRFQTEKLAVTITHLPKILKAYFSLTHGFVGKKSEWFVFVFLTIYLYR